MLLKQKSVSEPILIESNGRMRVPVKMFLSDMTIPTDKEISQLIELASIEGAYKWVAALPGMHSNSLSISPEGIAVATENSFIPQLLDNYNDCGVRLIKTPLLIENINTGIIDNLFRKLRCSISVTPSSKPLLTPGELLDILYKGSRWALKHFGFDQVELDYIENKGSMFELEDNNRNEILPSIPAEGFERGLYNMGVLGKGSDFLALQLIDEILAPDDARVLDLKMGQLVFTLHCGAGMFGKTMSRYYSPKKRSNGFNEIARSLRKIKFHLFDEDVAASLRSRFNYFTNFVKFSRIAADSDEGKRMRIAINAMANYGYVNRIVITEVIRNAVRTTLNDTSIILQLLCDLSYNLVQKEPFKDHEIIVHRHGTCRTYPAAMMDSHPLFRQTGQPFLVLGTSTAESYICTAQAGAEDTFYSATYLTNTNFTELETTIGSKRRWSSHEHGSFRVYRYGSEVVPDNQNQSSRRDASHIVNAMTSLNIAKPVARLVPMAILMA